MTLNQALSAELKMEAANTRKIMERVPCERNDWKPHEKSMKLGNLANHICDLPGWVTMVISTSELDLAARDYKPVIPATTEELLAHHDKTLQTALDTLANTADDVMSQPWTLRRGDHIMFSMPKAVVIRSMALSHMYHHRGQLSVYLRLLDVPVPGMYGPSSDDVAAMMAAKA